MYKIINSNTVLRLADFANIPRDEANFEYQNFLTWQAAGNAPEPADQPTQADFTAAAIKDAARLLKSNREAIDSLLITRPVADHLALKQLRSEVIRISTLPQHVNGQVLVDLSTAANKDQAYALLLQAYGVAVAQFYAAIAVVNPAPSYRAEVKRDFDLVINQLKAAL